MIDTDPTATWPVGLRRLAEVIGPDKALRLAGERGGLAPIYVPLTAKPEYWLAGVIGLDALAALCDVYGGQYLEVPRGANLNQLKAEILGAQGTTQEIARRLGCTARYVRMVRNQDRDPDQFDFFEN